MSLGTVAGSTVQCGSWLAVAQTPNWKSCGVDWKPRAWSGLKPSCPVQDHGEAPAAHRLAERGLRHADGDEARDRVAADGHRAERRAGGILVALAEALDLDQPAPRVRRRRSGSCGSRWRPSVEVGRRPRGRGRTRRRAAHRAGSRRSRVRSRVWSRKTTSAAVVVDLEPLDVEGAVVEVGRRRVRVVAGAVVVAVGVGHVEDQRARHEVEQDRSLLVGGAAGRADRDDVEDARPAGDATSMLNEPSGAADGRGDGRRRVRRRCWSPRRRPCCRPRSCR